MGKTELKDRIQRFIDEYWDSPVGREHLQTSIDERQEVELVYRDLLEKRSRGEDITEETLRRLLPHSDTQYNRNRGARISTWPCITKDVVAWFEGAKWKTRDEWPETVEWLLNVVEAGSTEDWDTWYRLAELPMKKGFAAGFITPIIHCLNPVLPVVNSKVVNTYGAVAAELGLNKQISALLIEYPESSLPSVLEMVELLRPLGIETLNQWDIYCHWNVSKRLGGRILTKPVAELVAVPHVERTPVETVQERWFDIESLCTELLEAQHASSDYARFEEAIAEAFRVLGFQTDRISGAGNADVVASAALGEESFSMVIDAKSMKEGGTFYANSGYSQIKSHQEENEANYAVVIASDFASGNTVRFAEDQSICLMKTDELLALLRTHADSPISLYFLKSLFDGKAGRISVATAEEQLPRNDRIEAAIAVLKTFELHQRERESDVPCLTEDQVHLMLRAQSMRLPKEHVEEAVALLANPLVDILCPHQEGYVLTVPAVIAGGRLRTIANKLMTLNESGE